MPTSAFFFVEGEVRSPGQSLLKKHTTIRKAIILVGGFTEFAARKRVRVRRIVDGQPRDFAAQMEDLVQAGDVIIVP